MAERFKTFILTEKAKAKDALRFFEYEHQDHDTTAKKIKDELLAAWLKIAEKIPAIEAEEGDDVDELDPKSREVAVGKTELTIGRAGNKFSVPLSVRVGSSYEREVKTRCKRELLAAALKVFEKYRDKMNTTEGTAKPFVITQDDDQLSNIRLKFKTGEFVKTVFVIGIEPGYKFERVYFKDNLQK